MNFDELCKRTHELASNGREWHRILFDDRVNDAYCELSRKDELDKDKMEAAFVQGRREFRAAQGWVIVWTTAVANYDQFDTEELECCDWDGKLLRKVLVEPGNLVYQRGRYLSGAMYWDEDPRETERKIREKIAKERAEQEERDRIRTAGLEWLRSADLSQRTDEDHLDREIRSRGLTWSDVRAEQKRRDKAQKTTERTARWNECRATFADGCTIVDPGRDAERGKYGPIPGSDCAVYRNVKVVQHWQKLNDPNEATVEDERGELVGLMWFVADRLTKGEYRIAGDDERLPPTAVLDRLKPSRLDRVVRVECEGRVVWAARENYSYSIIVLDKHGKIVRKKSIKEAAEAAVRAKRDWR